MFSNFAKKLPLTVRTMEDFLSHDKGELTPGPSNFFNVNDLFYGTNEDSTHIGKLLRRTRSPAIGLKAEQGGGLRGSLRDSGDNEVRTAGDMPRGVPPPLTPALLGPHAPGRL